MRPSSGGRAPLATASTKNPGTALRPDGSAGGSSRTTALTRGPSSAAGSTGFSSRGEGLSATVVAGAASVPGGASVPYSQRPASTVLRVHHLDITGKEFGRLARALRSSGLSAARRGRGGENVGVSNDSKGESNGIGAGLTKASFFPDLDLLEGGGSKKKSAEDSQRMLLADSQVCADPFQVRAWQILLEERQNSETFEKALEYFPTCAKFWQQYAEMEVREGNVDGARAIYKRSVGSCPHPDLWTSFLKFCYCTVSAAEFVAMLFRSIETVGMDPLSSALWKEYLCFRIKLWNAAQMQKDNARGLLFDPFHSRSAVGGTGETPLLPEASEKLFFDCSIPNSSATYIGQFTDVAGVRKAFQNCLTNALSLVDSTLAAYRHFERAVSTNVTLAVKAVAEQEQRADAARLTFKRRNQLLSGVCAGQPALPLLKANAQEQRTLVEKWRAVLEYEKSNPLRLDLQSLEKRVVYMFQSCLLTCAYHADIWFDFFQFLLAHNLPKKAVEVLRRAIDRFLPHDELLKLALADFLEEQHKIEAAEEVYRSLLTSVRPPALGGEERESVSLGSPAGLIAFLSFVRRNYGIVAWHRSFQEIQGFRSCTWEVFASHAVVLWRRYRDHSSALQVFKQGQERFGLNPRFIAALADFLLETGELDGAREILCRGVADIYREKGLCSRVLWNKWMRLEVRFGDKSSLRAVQELRIRQQSKVSIEDAELKGFGVTREKNALLDTTSDEHACAEEKVLCGLDQSEGDGDGDSAARMHAALCIRRRQLAGGDHLLDLYERYAFEHVHPRTSIVAALSPEPGDTRGEESNPDSDDLFLGREEGFDDGSDDERLESLTQKQRWDLIVRPDVTQMLAFKPAFSSPYQPTRNDYGKSAATNANLLGVAAPPRALSDLLCVLPRTNCVTDHVDLVDQLVTSLQCIVLPSIRLDQYEPVDVKEILALQQTDVWRQPMPPAGSLDPADPRLLSAQISDNARAKSSREESMRLSDDEGSDSERPVQETGAQGLPLQSHLLGNKNLIRGSGKFFGSARSNVLPQRLRWRR